MNPGKCDYCELEVADRFVFRSIRAVAIFCFVACVTLAAAWVVVLALKLA